jgi:bifunctional non-homologous end joining protein LigD
VRPPEPMLASPMAAGQVLDWSDWALEEKFDGHRVLVRHHEGAVEAWSRGGKPRELPAYVRAEVRRLLPPGLYDGELMAEGEVASFADVRRIGSSLYLVLFDVLECRCVPVEAKTYDERRRLLEACRIPVVQGPLRLAPSMPLSSADEVSRFVAAIWERGGEGAILKRRRAPYRRGTRSPDWIKVKKRATEALTVTGFEASKGKLENRGQFAVVKLRADDGTETTVKTKNYKEITKLNEHLDQWLRTRTHPAIGRRLRVEYAYRDPRSAAFVNPRWDRWEDE